MIADLDPKQQSHTAEIWKDRFITADALNDLNNDAAKDFIERRALTIAEWVENQMTIL